MAKNYSNPWEMDTDSIFLTYSTTENGLSASEAKTRKEKFGPNRIQDKKRRTPFVIFISQFKNWLSLILLAAVIISFWLKEKIDPWVILGIIIMSAFLGFFQEYKAERTLEKLKKLITHKARVRRDNKWLETESENLVSGDVVQLRIGDRVPADLRIIFCDNLSVDESILTGESVAVLKSAKSLKGVKLTIMEQKNMLFTGTYITSGIGTGVVVATGKNTVMGKTSLIMQQKIQPSGFQKQIKNFSTFLFRIILIMTAFVFIANALFKKGIFDSLLFALALAVGITPELMPVIMTVSLSQGALNMSKKQIMVKRLVAIENFGNIDILCTDKTGTLTLGKFSLVNYIDLQDKTDEEILLYGLLCSSAFGKYGSDFTANQVDKALWDSRQKKIVDSKLQNYELVNENEFDFNRKLMSVVVNNGNKSLFIVKGTTEQILQASDSYYENEKIIKINDTAKIRIGKKVEMLEDQGYRVISVAYKNARKDNMTIEEEKELVFRGFLIFEDPVKEGAKDLLGTFQEMGVNIKIISGDSPEIVKKTAIETGLADEHARVITGKDIVGASEVQLKEIVSNNSLFARIVPEQKNQIVLSLKKDGHIIGYLGDGINDAPAIMAADVGIAVDSGADIAKEAADIIMLQKDLKVLAEGIKTGRKTFGNFTKYILNTVSANYGNMFTVAISSLFLPFIPLLPAQILLNNFISDIPLLGIATDNVDSNYLKKPRKWNIRFITRFMIYFGFLSSLFDFALILPLILLWKKNPDVFRTAWFIESSLSEMLITFTIRTTLPFYRSKPNRWLVILTIISAFFVIILPIFGATKKMLSFSSLPAAIIMWIAAVLIIYFISSEILKRIFFRKYSL